MKDKISSELYSARSSSVIQEFVIIKLWIIYQLSLFRIPFYCAMKASEAMEKKSENYFHQFSHRAVCQEFFSCAMNTTRPRLLASQSKNKSSPSMFRNSHFLLAIVTTNNHNVGGKKSCAFYLCCRLSVSFVFVVHFHIFFLHDKETCTYCAKLSISNF